MNAIRRAEERDIPALLRLLVQVDMVHHRLRPDLFRGPATKYDADELHALLGDGDRPVFVCVGEDGGVLGYAFCILRRYEAHPVMTDILTLYIDDLCVDEAVRGQHVGRNLFEFVTGYARERGCYNVTLNVWSANVDAMRFYERCGLVPQKIGMEMIL